MLTTEPTWRQAGPWEVKRLKALLCWFWVGVQTSAREENVRTQNFVKINVFVSYKSSLLVWWDVLTPQTVGVTSEQVLEPETEFRVWRSLLQKEVVLRPRQTTQLRFLSPLSISEHLQLWFHEFGSPCRSRVLMTHLFTHSLSVVLDPGGSQSSHLNLNLS